MLLVAKVCKLDIPLTMEWLMMMLLLTGLVGGGGGRRRERAFTQSTPTAIILPAPLYPDTKPYTAQLRGGGAIPASAGAPRTFSATGAIAIGSGATRAIGTGGVVCLPSLLVNISVVPQMPRHGMYDINEWMNRWVGVDNVDAGA
jgi:hypothetical protein